MSRPDKVLVRTRREGAAAAPLQQQVGSLARWIHLLWSRCGALNLGDSATRRLKQANNPPDGAGGWFHYAPPCWA